MATCTLTLDIGYGPDVAATGYVGIQRINRGDNGAMMVEAAATYVNLQSPFPTVVLEQGITYRFDTKLSGGGSKVLLATIPASSTANYSDLVDLDPAAVIVPPNALMSSGTGSPEGVLTGTVGQLYTDTAITNGAAVWRKNSGTGNTGWVVVAADTGWRNIATDITNAWTVGTMRIRRVRERVEVSIATLQGSAATADAIYSLPSGFRLSTISSYSNSPRFILSTGNGFTTAHAFTVDVSAHTWRILGTSSTVNNWHVVGSYVTNDAWPTTLPGTAA